MISNNTSVARYMDFKVLEDDDCPICLEPLKDTDTVAHESSGGFLHPLHKSCAKSNAVFNNINNINNVCPICRDPTNSDSLLTLEERMKLITKDHPILSGNSPAMIGTIAGIATGLIIGTLIVIIAPQIRFATGMLPPIFGGAAFGGSGGFVIRLFRESSLRAEIASTTLDNTIAAAEDSDADDVVIDIEDVNIN